VRGFARVSRFGGHADEQWSALLGLGVPDERADRDVGLTGGPASASRDRELTDRQHLGTHFCILPGGPIPASNRV